ncbi:MAG: oligosaccharide flippase family protein [Chloroflexi bacterium]|nr:oligosaccharide flippase family protein [Chloroflexota bacterium]
MGQGLGRRDILAVAFLLALAFAFFGPVTLGDEVLLPTDNLYLFPPWREFASRFNITYPHNELISDMVLQNYAWKEFIKKSYLSGYFPLWNPYILSGTPFLATGQEGALYPLGIIFIILPVPQAYGWFSLLHLFLGGLFMYLYLRTLEAGRWGALVSAVTFAFAGFLIVSLLWPMIVSTIIWLPLLLLATEQVIRGVEAKEWSRVTAWMLAGAIGMGIQLLTSHVEYSFYILFTLLFYSGARLIFLVFQTRRLGPSVRAGAILVAMVGLGTGLAAVQLVPFSELAGQNYRIGQLSYEEVVGYAYPLRQVAAFLMPDFFGNPTHSQYWNVLDGGMKTVVGSMDAFGNARGYPFWGVKNYVEGTAYLGFLPLVLAAIAILRKRSKYVWIFATYGAFSLLLVFGTPLFRLFFYGIPGFQQLHTPFRWVFPYSVSVAILAGLGADYLVRNLGDRGKSLATYWGGVGLGAGGFFLLVGLVLSRLFVAQSLAWLEEIRQRSEALSRAFPTPEMLYSYQFRNFLLFALFITASGLIVALLARRLHPFALLRASSGGLMPEEVRRGWLLPAALVGVVAGELFLFGYNFNSATEAKLLDFVPPSIEWLQRQEGEEPFRVVSFHYQDVLPPITAMAAGLQDIRGYDTIILKQYVEFWSLLEEPHGLLYSKIHKLVDTRSLSSPLLDLMNVKYVLTTESLSLPHYTLAYQGEVNIYQNEDVLPRAFAVFGAQVAKDKEAALASLAAPDFNPSQRVILEGEASPMEPGTSYPFVPGSVTRYEPNQVEVAIEMPRAGYLVLSDSYDPGWRAWRDGQEVPLLRGDRIFRAVFLPPGKHTVLFKYFPDSLRLGLLLSLASGVIILLGAGALGWRRLYGMESDTSTARRVAKNSLTPMAAQIVGKVLDFAFIIFALRYLGPENAGRYSFAVVLIGYFLIFTDFGLGTLLTREVAKDKAQGVRYLGNAVAARLGLFVVSLPFLLGIVAIYSWRFGLSADTQWTIFLFAVSLIPSGIAGALSSVFMAHEKMEYPAAMTVVTTLIRTTLGVMVLLWGWGIVGLGGVSVVASTFTAMIFYFLVRHLLLLPQLRLDIPFQRQMLSNAAPLMVNNFLSTVFFRLDVMLLQPMRGDRDMGYYTTAYRFLDALNLIPSLFTLALFPVMSRYVPQALDSLARLYHRALKVLFIISWPIAVGTTLIADRIIIFFFGQEYAPSIAALQILIWFLPFSFVNALTQYVLIALNQLRFLTKAFLIVATFNFVANLVLIPIYGFHGAAAVTILSEIVLLIPFLYAIFRHLGPVPLLQLGWRPLVASLGMGLALFLMRQWSPVVFIPLGAVAYVALLFLIGTFDREDIALLRQLRSR